MNDLITLLPPVLFDTPVWEKHFGDVLEEPEKEYGPGDTVHVSFVSYCTVPLARNRTLGSSVDTVHLILVRCPAAGLGTPAERREARRHLPDSGTQGARGLEGGGYRRQLGDQVSFPDSHYPLHPTDGYF